jgi:iron complex outermembrane receptor protein
MPRSRLNLAVSFLSIVYFGIANGEDQSAPGSEVGFGILPIAVTARRIEENIQRVPVAITVVPGNVLQDNGVFTTEAFGQMAPGLTVTQAYGSRDLAYFNIRGQLFGVVNYFDEVPITNPQPGSIKPQAALYSPLTVDAASAQVLRGPQGTLFGRNATGGAVLFSPNAPVNDFTAEAAASYGNFNYQEYGAILNLPFAADTAIVRLVADRTTRNGFTRNLFDGTELDDVDTNTFRGSVLLRPIEGLQSRFVFQHVHSSEGGSGAQLEYADRRSPFSTAGPLFTGIPTSSLIASEVANGPREVTIFHPTGQPLSNKDDESFFSNVTTFKASPAVTIKNIFGYYAYSDSHLANWSYSLIPFLNNLTPPGLTYAESNQQYTDEPQLQVNAWHDRFHGILGAFYSLNTPKGYAAAYTAFLSTVPTGTITADNIEPSARQTSVAGFAQGTLDLSDWVVNGLSLTGGIRLTHDDVKSGAVDSVRGMSHFSYSKAGCGPGGVAPTCVSYIPLEAASTATTYTVDVDYQFAPELLLYVGTRKGYRPGGFNSAIAQLTPFRSYKPEYVTDYELGVKSDEDLFGIRTRANIAMYYGQYRDIQVNTTVDLSLYTGSPTAQYGSVEQNAARARIRGLEAELMAQPVERLTVSMYTAYIDAHYDSFTEIIQQPGIALVPVDVSSQPFPNTPKWTYSLSLGFELPVPAECGAVTASAMHYWQAHSEGAAGGTYFEPWAAIDSWSNTNFTLAWRGVMRSRLDASLFLNNAFDQIHVTNVEAAAVLADRTALYSAPRMYGMKLAYRFGSAAH